MGLQLKTSKTIAFFDGMLRNKFKLSEYLSKDSPAVFFGIYTIADINTVLEHTGPKIIWYAGTDSTYKQLLEVVKMGIDDKTLVIAESKWIEDDLSNAGIKYEKLPMFIDDVWQWKPVPLGNCIYWYEGKNSRYGKQHVKTVQAAFPDTEIIIADKNSYPREQMPEVYAKSFCVVRMTEHDGLSQSVAEGALMGRMSVWNGGGDFALPYNDINDVIENIRKLKEGYNPKLIAKRARGYFFENEAKWAKIVLDLCGMEGIDSANIFYEDNMRCGSIFRIQRKKDIEAMGGLGTEQFERPWFSSKMQELGKKQLVTSKSSGFVAKEWKGAKNKGYSEEIKFHTYDKRYS